MEANGSCRMDFHMTGEARKRLVRAIAEYKETISEYMGAPSFAYRVDNITIDRDGVVTFGGEAGQEEAAVLLEYLEARGFNIGSGAEGEAAGDVPVETREQEETAQAGSTEAGTADAGTGGAEETVGENVPGGRGTAMETAEPACLTVSLPREGFTDTALENLRKIVDSKRTLLMKALDTDSLEIKVTEETVSFPWFKMPEEGSWEAAAYTHLASALCEMAKAAKRVTATEKETESEKYSFRCFLLRLGFVGAQFKHERAVLMKNLSGHAAFKTLAEAEAFNEKLKAKKAAERAAKKNDGESQENITQAQEVPAQTEEGSSQE